LLVPLSQAGGGCHQDLAVIWIFDRLGALVTAVADVAAIHDFGCGGSGGGVDAADALLFDPALSSIPPSDLPAVVGGLIAGAVRSLSGRLRAWSV